MALEKATIEIEGAGPGENISVLFNPNQYSLNKGNQLAEIGVPGLSAPILQYVRGNSATLAMELFFDTYEEQDDVRDHTQKIYDLLGIEAETHVPPICIFKWGTLSFRGVLESVSGRFTLFLSDGRPARATLNVSFKEFIDVEVLVRETPTQSADHTQTYIVRQGDTLSGIAAAEYEDPALWRPIASANRIHNPHRLVPGQRLVIPPLT